MDTLDGYNIKSQKLTGLNYYGSRAAMPIKQFNNFNSMYEKLLATKEGERLKEKVFNRFHRAHWILNKYIIVTKERFAFVISHGCRDDLANSKSSKSHSSWEHYTWSVKGENFIDFVIRMSENYEQIKTKEYVTEY